jgi:hypothetical protein
MVKPPIVWGTLSFREEGRPDQKKNNKMLSAVLPNVVAPQNKFFSTKNLTKK